MLQKLFICNSDFQVTKNCPNFLSAILTLKIKKDTLQLTTKKQKFLLGGYNLANMVFFKHQNS